MTPEQQSRIERLRQEHQSASDEITKYWTEYSNFDSPYFWICVLLLVLPLAVLYFKLDKEKAFRIGFFGFNVHMWFHYMDTLGVMRGWWEYPYKVFPFIPVSVTLDASLVPVSYMLMYQWALNRGRNLYLWLILLSAVFAFVIKPLMSLIDMFWMFEWMNFFWLFGLYILIAIASLWMTEFFALLQKRSAAAR